MWFFNLIGGIKGIAVLAILVLCGGYIWKINNDVSTAEAKLKIVSLERDNLNQALNTAIQVNKTNLDTIKSLKNERDLAQSSLNNLELEKKETTKTISVIRDKIKAQSSDPENTKKISPVLKETILNIQANRALRAGSK